MRTKVPAPGSDNGLESKMLVEKILLRGATEDTEPSRQRPLGHTQARRRRVGRRDRAPR